MNRQTDFFITNKITPDYKDIDNLQRFLSSRMRVVSREKSGVNAKNQRKLAKAIKIARYLALIPYTSYQGSK
jgi:small subunit ribosomal protein S18